MGCSLCNMASISVSECDGKFTVTRVTDKEMQEAFLKELAYDIASQHPEMVNKINDFVSKLKVKRRINEFLREYEEALGIDFYAVSIPQRERAVAARDRLIRDLGSS